MKFICVYTHISTVWHNIQLCTWPHKVLSTIENQRCRRHRRLWKLWCCYLWKLYPLFPWSCPSVTLLFGELCIVQKGYGPSSVHLEHCKYQDMIRKFVIIPVSYLHIPLLRYRLRMWVNLWSSLLLVVLFRKEQSVATFNIDSNFFSLRASWFIRLLGPSSFRTGGSCSQKRCFQWVCYLVFGFYWGILKGKREARCQHFSSN